MKKIAFLMLMIILLLTLCGCSHNMSTIDDKPQEIKAERTRFIEIESYTFGRIVVDSETGVEYWVSMGMYNTGTLTLLVDESGNPKVRKQEY